MYHRDDKSLRSW